MSRFYAAFLLLFLYFHPKIIACGFNFVGDCSTSISLKINGTQDSFAVAPCPGVLKFDGFELGNLQTLSLVRAKAATWESCYNNVSGVELWYRVYEQGFPGGTWKNLDLSEDYNTLVGPYTTRYRSANTNENLTAGLTVGNTYVLEVYFRAAVDTVGDDFVPETSLLQNNNGQNYHFTFQYGGASAPPFIVVPTKAIDVTCHGDSTGVAGVTVYGNQGGLFYQWSTGGNNFYILSEIPAGIYSVTVTGAGGYSASDTIEISQPGPIEAAFTTIGPGCDDSPGLAAVALSGGMPPYTYVWENGQEDSVAAFPLTGFYALTATDMNGCSRIFSVYIPERPIEMLDVTVQLCAGETYVAGGTEFMEAGNYQITLPGINGACDTLLQLSLGILSPPEVDLTFQTVEPVACTILDSMYIVLKADTPAGAEAFEWVLNGTVISTADTCRFALAGAGMIPVVTVTGANGCSTQTGGFQIAIPQPPPLVVQAVVSNPAGGFDNGAVALNPDGGLPPYTVLWSTGATVWTIDGLGPGTYCATVTDARGCTVETCETLASSGVTDLPDGNTLKIAPNPAAAGRVLEISIPEKFSGEEVRLEILDLQGRTLLRQMVSSGSGIVPVLLPGHLSAGVWMIRLEGSSGKRATGRFTVY